jgi:hypothetical protein
MMLLKSATSRTLMASLSSVDLPQPESPTMTGRTKIDVGNREPCDLFALDEYRGGGFA